MPVPFVVPRRANDPVVVDGARLPAGDAVLAIGELVDADRVVAVDLPVESADDSGVPSRTVVPREAASPETSLEDLPPPSAGPAAMADGAGSTAPAGEVTAGNGNAAGDAASASASASTGTAFGGGSASSTGGTGGTDVLIVHSNNVANINAINAVVQWPNSPTVTSYWDGGAGINTLRIMDATAASNLDLTFDQTTVANATTFTPSEHVQNIGIIDLMTATTANATINGSTVFTGAAAVAGYGNQANTLRFDLQTILDIGPLNQFNSSNGWGPLAGSVGGTAVHQLVVDGDAADKVNWSTVTDAVVSTYGAGAWTKAGSVSHADGSGTTQTYDIWNFASSGNSGAAAAVYAQLILDSDITRLKDSATTSAGTW